MFLNFQISLNGFWLNDLADKVIAKVIGLVNVFLAMWSNYDPEGASCVVSPIIQYAINDQLQYENTTFTFDYKTCLVKV